MNRFQYAESTLQQNESYIARELGVRIYDGDQKTSFESGELVLTTFRILWGRPGDIPRGLTCLTLPLQVVIFVEEESPSHFSFKRSRKIVFHLSEPIPDQNPGPTTSSQYNYIKLSFKESYSTDFFAKLHDAIQRKQWEISIVPSPSTAMAAAAPNIKLRTGIVGIERSLQEKHKATDESITKAFQDLSKLMTMAKDMVHLSRSISNKIRDRQGDITEDETIRFKSYLMSLGIDDPVTRDSYKSNNKYYKDLAKQISDILADRVNEVGGMMSLTDVYCRVNRARGLELLSPEDLLNACKQLDNLQLPVKLHEFESGVRVLQLQSLSNENVANTTLEILEGCQSLTSEELAQSLGISVMLAKERLMTTERYGKACRDDTIEGLRFYPNLLLTRDD
ncbi:Vacuolar protein sorting 36 [Carabus blaptoides fortunei]